MYATDRQLAQLVTLHVGDAVDTLASMPESSVDLILTDPPYHRVKGEAWDRQWKTDADYLSWLGTVADGWRRVLKPNGSLYCFASPRMAARVEVLIGERFNVLNSVVWRKPDANCDRRHVAQVIDRNVTRGWFPQTERIVFAEHYGADNMAKGEAGYAAKCDELRGFVFEPLRAYFDSEKRRCGISNEQIMDGMAARGVGRFMFARHTFSRSQWQLPTREQYDAARDLFDTFAKTGEDLRREYEDLRREYEDLRRPFSVTADVPYTDVWTFPTVPARKGKHPCEKPADMIRHMIRASSRPGAVVLDTFAGSGVVGMVAAAEGRQAILVERDAGYADIIRRRLAGGIAPSPVAPSAAVRPTAPARSTPKPSLFDGLDEPADVGVAS